MLWYWDEYQSQTINIPIRYKNKGTENPSIKKFEIRRLLKITVTLFL